MITLTKKIYVGSELDFEETYIVSETGHFDNEGEDCGWVICLGSNDSPDNYKEVDDGVHHDVPEIADVHLPAGFNDSYEIGAEEALRIIAGDDVNEK